MPETVERGLRFWVILASPSGEIVIRMESSADSTSVGKNRSRDRSRIHNWYFIVITHFIDPS